LAKLPRWEKIALLERLGKSSRPSEPAENLTRYRNDPVGFCREVLGVEPWEKQEEILRALATLPRVTVRSCNNSGKTMAASWATLWYLYTRPNSIVVTTAPTNQQVKNLLWRRLRGAHAGARVPLPGKPLTQMLELGPEWYAIGISTDEEVNFQGPHSTAGVMMIGDEASGLADWLYAAMQGAMTEEGAKMLLIGNPNVSSGFFYDSHLRWASESKFHISAFDVPERVLRPSWREQMLEDCGGDEQNPVYQVRVLGEFPDQGDDSLIAMRWVTAAQEREVPGEGEIIFGVDCARFGSDENVCYVRQGPAVLHGEMWRGINTMASAARIAALAKEWKPAAINVDDIGVGGGIVDRLAEEGFPVVGVNVGEAARDSEKYANRRSEIFFGLAERFKAGDITIPAADTRLMAQLVALKKQYTARGQMKLESKDDMRKRLPKSGSPDRADALALSFAICGNKWLPWSGLGETRDF
jgi:phage terminase large subunit